MRIIDKVDKQKIKIKRIIVEKDVRKRRDSI